MKEHKKCKGRYRKLQNYYEAEHDIKQSKKDAHKPNNKLVHPYPDYITNMLVGYFVGQAVKYKDKDGKSKKTLDKLLEVYAYADEAEHNLELAKTCSIKGKAFEIVYMDSYSKTRFIGIEPDEMFCVYDNTLENNIKYAVRFFEIQKGDKKVEQVEIYTRKNIFIYQLDNEELKLIEEKEHYFGDVPVVEYENNKEAMGDFEKVLSLVDAYDKSQSNTLNDMDQFTDAYLCLSGYQGTEDADIAKMREDQVLLLDEKGAAQWLVKNINDTWVENFKTRLKNDIHKFSATPDMSDENFGSNLSGVSLRYKLLAMEQVRAAKERKFRKGLQRRIELICTALKITTDIEDYTNIEMSFNNTLPQNVQELSQIIQNLAPWVSLETLLSQLPFIDSATDEIGRKKQEVVDDLIDYNFTHDDDGDHDERTE